jgi:CRP-like cAMP-binding protein
VDRPDGAHLRANRLLGTLDDATLAVLAKDMETVVLTLRQQLYRENEPIEYAYFPTQGVVSMLASIEGSGAWLEVATIGNEGMVGLQLFLGTALMPGIGFSQIPGGAFRMSADSFLAATGTPGPLTRVLHRYTQAMLVQVSQATACNRLHTIEQRCARWILMTHDRVDTDEFPLRQDFLGLMLGENGSLVNLVSSMLQKAGFIAFDQRSIRVLDRPGLLATCCRCYHVIREEYDRMLAGRYSS